MIAALALISYIVQPGNTLSGIASSHGATLAAVEIANPQIHDPNLIFAGQTITLPNPSGKHVTHTVHAPKSTPAHHTPAHSATAHQAAATHHAAPAKAKVTVKAVKAVKAVKHAAAKSAGSSSTDLADIPGVPHSFAACVAFRESTDLKNPAANGNAYGIIPSSGYNVSGTSIAHQKQVFSELYHQYGGHPWLADGCPGT